MANGGGITCRPLAYSFECLDFGQLSVTPLRLDLAAPRGISVGALSESKILKMSGHVQKTQKLGPFIVKRANTSGLSSGLCLSQP
jgi:hypothetical protein